MTQLTDIPTEILDLILNLSTSSVKDLYQLGSVSHDFRRSISTNFQRAAALYRLWFGGGKKPISCRVIPSSWIKADSGGLDSNAEAVLIELVYYIKKVHYETAAIDTLAAAKENDLNVVEQQRQQSEKLKTLFSKVIVLDEKRPYLYDNKNSCQAVTLFHFSVTYNLLKLARCLLDMGVSANLPGLLKIADFNGTPAPIHMAIRCQHTEMVQLLLDYGAKLDDYERVFEKPIIYASQIGNVAMVQFLLEHGASDELLLNFSDHPHTLQYLLASGFRPTDDDCWGTTLESAVDESRENMEDYQEPLERFFNRVTVWINHYFSSRIPEWLEFPLVVREYKRIHEINSGFISDPSDFNALGSCLGVDSGSSIHHSISCRKATALYAALSKYAKEDHLKLIKWKWDRWEWSGAPEHNMSDPSSLDWMYYVDRMGVLSAEWSNRAWVHLDGVLTEVDSMEPGTSENVSGGRNFEVASQRRRVRAVLIDAMDVLNYFRSE